MAGPSPTLVVTWAPTGRLLTYPWTWVDVTGDVRAVNIERGRQSELDAIRPGEASIVLDNRDRSYDPANAAGAYYGDLGRGRPVRVATGYRYLCDASNPLSYLPLDEASGSTFTDMRALGDGTLGGSDISYAQQGPLTALTDGAIKINTSGSTTYLTQPHNAAYAVDENTLTVAVWVKMRTGALNHSVYSKGYTGGLTIRINVLGDVQCRIGATTVAQTSGGPCSSQNDTTWYHVVYVKDGTSAGDNEIYVNGVAQTLATDAAGTIADTAESAINWGRGYESATPTYGNYLLGYLAHAAIFDTALTAAEVAALYASAPSPCAALFTGATEVIPQSFTGHDATVTMNAVDGLAALQGLTVDDASTYQAEVEADSPWGWWRMRETTYPAGVNAMVVSDHSGNDRHARHNSASVAIGGDPIVGPSPSVSYGRSSALGQYTAVHEKAAQTSPPPPPFSIEFWCQFDSRPESSYDPDFTDVENPLLMWVNNPIAEPGDQYALLVRLGLRFDEPSNNQTGVTTALWVDWTDDPQSGDVSNEIDTYGYTCRAPLAPFQQTAGIVPLFDGRPHHVVVTAGSSFPGSDDFLLYVDGEEQTVWGSATIDAPLRVAGQMWTVRWGEQLGGRMSEVALYGSELSAARVLAHYEAGARDWRGQTTGQRVTAIADGVGWPGLLRDIDTGATVMGLVATANTAASDLLDAVDAAENGLLYIDARGYLRFVGRAAFTESSGLFNTSQATFTDDTADLASGTHVHKYVMGGFAYDIDRSLLRNVVKADAPDPSIDYYLTADATSIAEQGQQHESRSLVAATRTDLKGWADTRLALYKDPLVKFEGIMVYPDDRGSSVAAAFQQLFDLELGHAVTTKRTPRSGAVISATSRLEMIRHEITASWWLVEVGVSSREASESVWVLGTSSLDEDTTVTW